MFTLKGIILGQISILNKIFYVVVSVHLLVKIWNSPQFPAELRNTELNLNADVTTSMPVLCPSFPQIQKSKTTGDCSLDFKFFRSSVGKKQVMRFQKFSNFSGAVWTRPGHEKYL